MELVRDIKSCLKIKKEQILGVIFGLLMQASYALLAIFINQMVETIENDTFVFSEHAFKILGVLVVTIIVQFIYPYLFRLMFIKADKNTDFFALNRIMQKDVNFFKNNSSGEVFNLTKNVCSDIGSYYASFWPNIIINIFSFVITLGILFYYSYIMALIVLALIIILSILVSKVSNKIANYSKEAIQSQNRVFTNFNELLGNFRIIKMLKQNRYYEETYKTSYSSDYFVKIKHFKLLEALYTALYGILVYLLPLITLVLGILFKDYLMIGLGAVIAMYSVIGNLQEPIRQTAVVIGDYKKNKQNLLLVKDLLEIKPTNKKTINDFEKLEFKSDKGIFFNEKNILNNLNFVVNKGDFCLLSGESGCGKSTILKLIMQEDYYDDISIKINDKNAFNLDYNCNILCVTQDNYLFHDTILNNICCGTNYSKEELEEIYDICELTNFIKDYKEDKEVDQMDSNISGGEKQRICLARILIRKPKLLLLDEITASLDKNTTTNLSKKVSEYCKKNDITVIAISHKNEFDNYANKVIKI